MKLLPMLVLALSVLLVGCPSGGVQLPTLAQAVEANNATVMTLRQLQTTARELRAGIMAEIARTATSKEAGLAAIDAVDKRFAPVFDLFQKAEKVQALLASALEAAQAAKDPDIASVLEAYAKLQALYGQLLAALAKAK